MEAEQAFIELREAAGTADLDTPPLARLAPIAKALGYPKDWRLHRPRATDIGERPALDSLGPAGWSLPEAPSWFLEDAKGRRLSLANYRGRPVVVIFYLGAGCLHCVEQLETIAPLKSAFADAGITLIGVSTDDREKLGQSLQKYGDEPFPFPLVTDSGLDAFRAYGAFDEFNDHPLHGTFLIGPDGRIRWRDVDHEPFSAADFLLEESKRLLAPTVEKPGRNRAPIRPAPTAGLAGTPGRSGS